MNKVMALTTENWAAVSESPLKKQKNVMQVWFSAAESWQMNEMKDVLTCLEEA